MIKTSNSLKDTILDGSIVKNSPPSSNDVSNITIGTAPVVEPIETTSIDLDLANDGHFHSNLADFIVDEDVLLIDGKIIDASNLPADVFIDENEEGCAVVHFDNGDTITLEGITPTAFTGQCIAGYCDGGECTLDADDNGRNIDYTNGQMGNDSLVVQSQINQENELLEDVIELYEAPTQAEPSPASITINDFVAGVDTLTIGEQTIHGNNLPQNVSVEENENGHAVIILENGENITLNRVTVEEFTGKFDLSELMIDPDDLYERMLILENHDEDENHFGLEYF